MQVNLKQKEIETALRNYIAQQGIELYGKSVTISFTAGRRESGISAELIIDDQEIPGFTDTDAEVAPTTPVLKLAPIAPTMYAEASEVKPVEVLEVLDAPVEDIPVPQMADEVVVTDPPIKTNSLFS